MLVALHELKRLTQVFIVISAGLLLLELLEWMITGDSIVEIDGHAFLMMAAGWALRATDAG